MKRIGIVGENFENDARAFAALLTPQYKDRFTFLPFLKTQSGQITAIKKMKTVLPIEIEKHNLDAVLFIRDLDTEMNRTERQTWFKEMNAAIDVESVFYLAEMELEALILADIETFNSHYGIKGQYNGNPKTAADPKKELRKRTEKAKRKYDENHALEIFKKLNFHIVYKKHSGNNSFQAFIDTFNSTF